MPSETGSTAAACRKPLEMFKAGYHISIGERSYYPYIDDEEIECVLMRAQRS